MRVLICGSRLWTDPYPINCILNGYTTDLDAVTVISGMAKGADSLAAFWAMENNVELLEFPALWNVHGRAAGPIRNQQMLDEGKPEVVWAFKTTPVSVGTDDMIERAAKAGLDVFVVTRVSEAEVSQ